MNRKFKPDNRPIHLFWIFLFALIVGMIFFRIYVDKNWSALISFTVTSLFIMMVTIKEYRVTEQNFLEIHYLLHLFTKPRRIAIGDMVSITKLKKNALRIDKVRGFEVLRVKSSDMDAFIAELTDRNPRIIFQDKPL